MKFNKDIEYALMALRYLQRGEIISARRLADQARISSDLLSKILQKLGQAGLVESVHGAQGGYRMRRDPAQVTVQDIVNALHDVPRILPCTGLDSCSLSEVCSIRPGMQGLQAAWDALLSHVTLSSLYEIDRHNARQVLLQALSA